MSGRIIHTSSTTIEQLYTIKLHPGISFWEDTENISILNRQYLMKGTEQKTEKQNKKQNKKPSQSINKNMAKPVGVVQNQEKPMITSHCIRGKIHFSGHHISDDT